jgi:hypothetical protein
VALLNTGSYGARVDSPAFGDVLVLLLAATEIFACQLISPDSCMFSNHSRGDSDEGGSGDGCLCCCAHIVVVVPTVAFVSLGFVALTVPFEDFQAPAVPPSGIEHLRVSNSSFATSLSLFQLRSPKEEVRRAFISR